MNYLELLPDEIYHIIYKDVYNEVLKELHHLIKPYTNGCPL